MTKSAADKIAAELATERLRQIRDEGWSADHDDEHGRGVLPKAAMSYCQSASVGLIDTSILAGKPPTYWPWDAKWWKPKTARRDLVRAGALIIAEIERLDRETP